MAVVGGCWAVLLAWLAACSGAHHEPVPAPIAPRSAGAERVDCARPDPEGIRALTEEQRALLAWFGGLGFPDVGCRPLVEVATGQWVQWGNEPPRNTFVLAFLLDDDGSRFTVLTVDLVEATYTRTPHGVAEHERVGVEPVDLAEATVEVLERLERADEDDAVVQLGTGIPLGTSANLLVLASACAAAGRGDLAGRALRVAAALPDRSGDPPPLGKRVRAEMAHGLTWRAVVAFEDPTVDRRTLLERFTWLRDRFPETEHRERIAQTVDALQRLVEEDEAHVAPPEPLEALPVDQQVEELVFQLRDQNGLQWGQPGWCDVFSDPRGADSPAARLVRGRCASASP